MLEQTEGDGGIVANTMKGLRLVNKHWSSWATRAIEMLKPLNVPLSTLLTKVTEKFVTLRCLKLDNMEKVGDEDLINLGKLPTLTCLSFDQCNYGFCQRNNRHGCEFLGESECLKRTPFE